MTNRDYFTSVPTKDINKLQNTKAHQLTSYNVSDDIVILFLSLLLQNGCNRFYNHVHIQSIIITSCCWLMQVVASCCQILRTVATSDNSVYCCWNLLLIVATNYLRVYVIAYCCKLLQVVARYCVLLQHLALAFIVVATCC